MKAFVAPEPDQQSSDTVLSLALIYLRHNQPDRALALGIAAMTFGPITPRMALLVADAFLRNGDAEQALAILSRFEGEGGQLSPAPDDLQQAAAHVLLAKAHQRVGDGAAARSHLAKAAAYSGEAA